MFAGDTATVTVSFTSSKDIRRAAVVLSPELATFVHPEFTSIERLRKGARRTIDLMFTVPADAQPGTLAGTIALARVEDAEVAEPGDRNDLDAVGGNPLLTDALPVALTIRRRPTAAAEWSTSRHDAQRSGRSPYVGPIDRAIVQSFVLDPAGEPVVAPDHRLFLPIARGFELAAFNPDGSLSVDVAVPFLLTAVGASRAVPTKLTVAADGTVYAAVLGIDFPNTGGIFAFDPTGVLKWQRDTNGPVSSPAIGADGNVYVTTQRHDGCGSRIIALRPDGADLWEYTYPDPGCRLGLSDVAVAPDGAVVVTVFGFSHVESHDPSTGAVRWSIDFGVTQGATAPAVAGDGTVYFVVRNALLYAVSAATGEIRWAHPLQLPGDTSVPSIAADGTIFVATVAGFATSRVAMLEAVTPSGDSKWSTELASGAAIAPCQVGGPQVALDANGNAFVSFNGNCSDVTAAPLLFGVTAAGAVTWSVDGFISATAIVGAADTLYAFGDLLGTQRGQAVHLFSITSR